MIPENQFKAAAHFAEMAVEAAMYKYKRGEVTDEDDLTGVLIGRLDAVFDNATIDGLVWSASILRHRKGIAAQEKAIGADMLIHFSIDTTLDTYSKGVLIQAKRMEPEVAMTSTGHKELIEQCNKMLAVTPAAFVFDYALGQMRCASATKIAGSKNKVLFEACNMTPYRFFYDLFRCPIGDKNITSALYSDLKVPIVLSLAATDSDIVQQN